jgi:hypothetical protein
MSIQLEAAFHEAGHAVITHRPKFHFIVGPINLQEYGQGEFFTALGKTQLKENGKDVDAATAYSDADVAVDLVIILAGGLVAERLAAEQDPVPKPNSGCARPDNEFIHELLKGARLPRKTEKYRAAAKAILTAEWQLVVDLAQYLVERESVDPQAIADFIDGHSSVPASTPAVES